MKRFIHPRRSAFTLLEILVSTVVLMVGVFGIAGAISFSEHVVKQSLREDMAANCGRAALDALITNMNFENDSEIKNINWDNNDNLLKDVCRSDLRQNLQYTINRSENEGADEILYPVYDTNLEPQFTCVGTIVRRSSYFEVTSAVSYKRYLDENRKFVNFNETFNVYQSNIDIAKYQWKNGIYELSKSFSDISESDLEDWNNLLVKGQYVFMSEDNFGAWYKIEDLDVSSDNIIYLRLTGPIWPKNFGNGNKRIQTPGGVIGVYSKKVPSEAN